MNYQEPELFAYTVKLVGNLSGKSLNLSVWAKDPHQAELRALDSFSKVHQCELIGVWYSDEMSPKFFGLMVDHENVYEVLVASVRPKAQ